MLRNFFLVSLLFLFSGIIKAQVPKKINFQTVVRSKNGTLLTKKTIGVRLSILKSTASGEAIYIETHSLSTDINGLLNLMIGDGVSTKGIFASINWLQGPYFLKSELDLTGSNNYSLVGVTEFLSVPYAMKVITSDTSTYTNSVKTLSTGESIGDMNYWNGTAWVPLKKGVQDQKLIFCNNQPVWAFKGVCPGLITTLNCTSSVQNGSLINNTVANGVTSLVPYVANGGSFSSLSINSTGVIGLVATLDQGILANGNGSLTFKISGKPTTSGTAFFDINIGGKTCVLTRTVNVSQ